MLGNIARRVEEWVLGPREARQKEAASLEKIGDEFPGMSFSRYHAGCFAQAVEVEELATNSFVFFRERILVQGILEHVSSEKVTLEGSSSNGSEWMGYNPASYEYEASFETYRLKSLDGEHAIEVSGYGIELQEGHVLLDGYWDNKRDKHKELVPGERQLTHPRILLGPLNQE